MKKIIYYNYYLLVNIFIKYLFYKYFLQFFLNKNYNYNYFLFYKNANLFNY